MTVELQKFRIFIIIQDGGSIYSEKLRTQMLKSITYRLDTAGR